MPCDQIRTVTIKWSTETDIDAMKTAFERLGYEVQLVGSDGLHCSKGWYQNVDFSAKTGRMEVTGNGFNEQQLKTEYSKAVVESVWESAGAMVEWGEETAEGEVQAGWITMQAGGF